MLKGNRRVAIAEDFFGNSGTRKDCLHAGTKKTYARVFASGALYLATN